MLLGRCNYPYLSRCIQTLCKFSVKDCLESWITYNGWNQFTWKTENLIATVSYPCLHHQSLLFSLFRPRDCSWSPNRRLLLHPQTGSGIFWQESDRRAHQPPLRWHSRGGPFHHRQPFRWTEGRRPGSCRCQYDGEHGPRRPPLCCWGGIRMRTHWGSFMIHWWIEYWFDTIIYTQSVRSLIEPIRKYTDSKWVNHIIVSVHTVPCFGIYYKEGVGVSWYALFAL